MLCEFSGCFFCLLIFVVIFNCNFIKRFSLVYFYVSYLHYIIFCIIQFFFVKLTFILRIFIFFMFNWYDIGNLYFIGNDIGTEIWHYYFKFGNYSNEIGTKDYLKLIIWNWQRLNSFIYPLVFVYCFAIFNGFESENFQTKTLTSRFLIRKKL